MEWLVGLNILINVLWYFLDEAIPLFILIWVICGVFSFVYAFLKPFIWFNKY